MWLRPARQTIVYPSIYPAEPEKGHPFEEPCVWEPAGDKPGQPAIIDAQVLQDALDAFYKHLNPAAEAMEVAGPASTISPEEMSRYAQVAQIVMQRLFMNQNPAYQKLLHWNDQFYVYDQGRYVAHGKNLLSANILCQIGGDLKRYDRDKDSYVPVGVNNRFREDLVACLRDLSILRLPDASLREPFDLRSGEELKSVLLFKNGYIDLSKAARRKDINLQTDSHRLFNTNSPDYDYDPEAKCPRWIKFLNEVSGGDRNWIKTLQMYLGYLLTYDTTQQKVGVFLGKKRAGKGTIAYPFRPEVQTNGSGQVRHSCRIEPSHS